jgi:hypothetical protein
MAACTQRYEKTGGVLPGLPVMDMQAMPRPAGPATAGVPFENGFAVPGEARPRMGAGAIPAGTEIRVDGSFLPAAAEQSSLATPGWR